MVALKYKYRPPSVVTARIIDTISTIMTRPLMTPPRAFRVEMTTRFDGELGVGDFDMPNILGA
jgi:hypothetical protein